MAQAGDRTVPLEAQADAAAEEGFPVTVQLDGYGDGPVTLTFAGQPTPTMHFVVENGRTTATTRERLRELVTLGGRPI